MASTVILSNMNRYLADCNCMVDMTELHLKPYLSVSQ